jgi:hypothetical protein
MSKRLMLVATVVLIVGLASGATMAVGQGAGNDDSLHARLTGSSENPAGDTNGKGSAGVVVEGRRVCLAVAVANLSTVAAFHIHKGARGQNGPIVVDPKYQGGGNGSALTLGRCVTVAQSLARDIKRNPGNYYVNVHTSQFPAGAIRGQLSRG